MKSLAVVAAGFSLLSLSFGCAGHHAPPGAGYDDGFSVVEIRPLPHQTLRDQIVEEASVAASRGLIPFLELTSAMDRRCFLVDHTFGDAGMREALRGTYIIRIDITRWVGRFGSTGLDRIPMAFPSFVEVSDGGHGLGPYIDARSWMADAPTAVAPSLRAFVRSFAEGA
jgi:hypothetical protein